MDHIGLLPDVIRHYILKYGLDMRWGVDLNIDYRNAEISGRQLYFDNLQITTTTLNLDYIDKTNTFIAHEYQSNFFNSNNKSLIDGTIFLYQYKNSEFYYIINHIDRDYIGKILEITHQLDPDMIDDMLQIKCYPCDLVCIKGVLFNIYDKKSNLYKLYEEESLLIENKVQIVNQLLPLFKKTSKNIIDTFFNILLNDSLNNYFAQKVEFIKDTYLRLISHNLNFLRVSQGLPGLNFNS